MRKYVWVIGFFVLFSCKEVNENLEGAFMEVAEKQDSISRKELDKIGILCSRLNAMELSEADRANVNAINRGISKFHGSLDSLVAGMRKRQINNEVIKGVYNTAVSRYERGIDSIREFEVEIKLDTIYHKEDGLHEFPKAAMLGFVYDGKLTGAKKAEVLLKAIEAKYTGQPLLPGVKSIP